MDRNFLREYRYSSILFIFIIIGVITGLSEVIVGEDSDISSYIGGIIGTLANYIICAGLLNTRMGNVSDYLSNFSSINIKVIGVNLIVSLLLVLGGVVFSTGTIFTAVFLSEKNMMIYLVLFIIIFLSLFYLVTAHTNFVLSDKRFRSLGFLESIGKVLSIGFKLFGQTLVLSLKYYLLPIVLSLLIILGVVNNSLKSLAIILFGILAIYLVILVFLLPGYMARLSDIYLDYVDEYYPYENQDENVERIYLD